MRKVTIHTLAKKKREGEKVVMITAYDATLARIVDDAGVDLILVGDSLGHVIQGHESTLPVTLDQMIYHCAAVSRGAKRAQIIGDMPFMSYQAGEDEAVKNAGRLIAEGGAQAVKLEGGRDFTGVVSKIVRAGIPVMGHIGLTPQSVHKLGGYRIQGKSASAHQALLDDARALEDAGIYSLVLEGVAAEVAEAVTAAVSVPTIGIGAGAGCDGQVLVIYDLLGLNPDFKPKFLKYYLDGYQVLRGAIETFGAEVREGSFPAEEHTFHAPKVRVVEDPEPEAAEGAGEPTKLYG
ncbi:MAG: 3-methyl-2-oxobutanoate hydroxymethyltransferase [Deltaproteobacteria bacterium]|nr:3-methyl-2-oxobutanoate hydroxymethyltransferase [Deltaproteobacteria bacterium]